MAAEPEQVHPELAAAFNNGDLEGVLATYDPKAVFVIRPGEVTDGPAELRAALQRLLELDARLTVTPSSLVRSDDVVLALGRYALTGRRRDGTPFDLDAGFADILRHQPDGTWRIAVDNGFTNA
ncbi:YybH family protein [Fodinicola feengrottensis]|uniref:SnoaL-like domain-containing protein n=1 Tax=Fodinicola feengrottensis TaxID=435914 RepID=A0ABN2IMN1_9ACTN|nr:nuclear transport factor 2 family protein [Fodinicola feengrottensis]